MGNVHDTIPAENQQTNINSMSGPEASSPEEVLYSGSAPSSMQKGPVSSLGNNMSNDDIYKEQSIFINGTGKVSIRFLNPDSSQEVISPEVFMSKLESVYMSAAEEYILKVRELDMVVKEFNDMILDNSKDGTRGFLLPSSYDAGGGEINPDIKKRKDKLTVKPISTASAYRARAAYNSMISLFSKRTSDISDVNTKETDDIGSAKDLISLNLKAFDYLYTLRDAAELSLPLGIKESTGLLIKRLQGELDLMKDDWKKYDKSWLEMLSISGDLNDSEMEEIISDLSSDLETLESFQTRFQETSNFDTTSLISFTEASREYSRYMLYGRYELNKILVAQESAGWHALYNAYGIAGSVASDFLGPAGSVLGGAFFSAAAEVMHQNRNSDTYEELGLEYDPDDSPHDPKMVGVSAVVGGATGGVMAGAGHLIGKGIQTAGQAAKPVVTTVAKESVKAGVREFTKDSLRAGSKTAMKKLASNLAKKKSKSVVKVVSEGSQDTMTYSLKEGTSSGFQQVAGGASRYGFTDIAGEAVETGVKRSNPIKNLAAYNAKAAARHTITEEDVKNFGIKQVSKSLDVYKHYYTRTVVSGHTFKELPLNLALDTFGAVASNNAVSAATTKDKKDLVYDPDTTAELMAEALYMNDSASTQEDKEAARSALERISKSSGMYKTREDLEKMSDRERMDFYNEVLIMINDSDENSWDYHIGQYYYELLAEIEESK